MHDRDGGAVRREQSPAPATAARSEADEAALLRQERLAQQMRDLEAQRAAASRRATLKTETAREAAELRSRAASSVRQDLRDPRTLRHAVILREVLGTPVGLR